MKRLLVFTLLLANSFWFKLDACGFYPWGEDVRFCYFKPEYLNFDQGYSYYNYTSDWYDFSAYDDSYYFFSGVSDYKPNALLWQQYCNNAVSIDAIVDAVYKIPFKGINKNSKNAMLRYLYGKKDTDAINYILFAKQCEQYTGTDEDPWEKKENVDKQPATALIKQAGERAGSVKNKQLKDRYLFLKIRLSFYKGKPEDIALIYNTYFKNASQKDLIYYWVLFFYIQLQSDPVTQNFYAAQVFAHTPDKRFVVRSNYDRSIPINETLALAKTPEEAANVWLMHGVREAGMGLPYIINVYKNNPSAAGLSFMLVREINKLEDWILTPQYSLFEPSTRSDYWENNNARLILARVKEDRRYAAQVLAFVNAADFSKTDNPTLWKLAQAYLAFMAQDNAKALTAIKQMEEQITEKESLYEPFLLIKGLVHTAAQQKGQAVIPEDVKPILQRQYKAKNYKYIFGLGRELEELGNTGLAAVLFSKANAAEGEENWEDDSTYWKAKNDVTATFTNYYMSYLSYIDAVYTTAQMQDFIDSVNNYNKKDAFNQWLYKIAANNKHELYRILGTKYLRESKLAEARDVFRKIDAKHDFIFEENPFYKIKFTPEFTASYNKKQKVNRAYIMDNLIKVLAKAENTTEKDRDYYYFLAANCYYNMSFHGNAWNMRRRFMSNNQVKTGFDDDTDFFGCKTAKELYLKAYNNAQTPKFKALCMRMVTECETNNLRYKYNLNWEYNYRYDLKIGANTYNAQFKKEYGSYYKELTGSCTAFSDYFKARR